MGFFIDLLLGGITAFFSRLLVDIIEFVGGAIANEHLMALELLDSPFVKNLTGNIQIVAGFLLGIKVAVEVTRQYILFSSGDSDSSPLKAIRRTFYAGAMIYGGPWLAREVFTWGAQLAFMVSQTPITGNIEPFTNIVNSVLLRPVVNMVLLIVLLVSIIFYCIVLLQILIRAIAITFLSVSAPIMAVGLTSQDEGVWKVWWRELVVLSLSQAVQMFFLTGFFSGMAGLVYMENFGFITLFMPIGYLYGAYKSPSVLKEFAYHTGVGGMVSNTARTYVTPMIKSLIPVKK